MQRVRNLQEIVEKLLKSEEDIENGKVRDAEEVFKEWENKYGILKEDIIEVLKKSEEEIEKGEGIESDEAFKELRQKYGY